MRSFANFKLALRVLAPAKRDDDYNKFKDSNLKAVEDVFGLISHLDIPFSVSPVRAIQAVRRAWLGLIG